MKFIKQHPIHENDSHLSQATLINKKAEKTIVDQEETLDQHLSDDSDISNNTESTVKQHHLPEQGDDFQKVSHDTEIENNTDIKVGGHNGVNDDDVEHTSNATKIQTNAKSTYKMNTLPSDDNQHLSTIGESVIITKFDKF